LQVTLFEVPPFVHGMAFANLCVSALQSCLRCYRSDQTTHHSNLFLCELQARS
jgi:hypothetical protein